MASNKRDLNLTVDKQRYIKFDRKTVDLIFYSKVRYNTKINNLI